MAREGAGGLPRQIRAAKRGAVVELAQWGAGAVGGAFFGGLPRGWRRRTWGGPVYGLLGDYGWRDAASSPSPSARRPSSSSRQP